MPKRKVQLLALVLTSCGYSPSSPSEASRARTPSGAPVYWRATDLHLVVAAPAVHSGVSGDALVRALAQATRIWNDALEGCPVPRLRVDPMPALPPEPKSDGVNAVVMRSGSWCPAGYSEASECYEPHRASITHLRFPTGGERQRGKLVEADVEINAVNFTWSGSQNGARLLAVLTHELGHVLGLDHSMVPSAVMYPDPLQPGRRPALEPTRAEIDLLCSVYGPRGQPQRRAP